MEKGLNDDVMYGVTLDKKGPFAFAALALRGTSPRLFDIVKIEPEDFEGSETDPAAVLSPMDGKRLERLTRDAAKAAIVSLQKNALAEGATHVRDPKITAALLGNYAKGLKLES